MVGASAGAPTFASVTCSGVRPNTNRVFKGSQPVMKPCIATPMIFDTTQYNANPLGKFSVKNPNINGIIHNIILFVDACLASIEGIAVIFCMIHMDDPTRIGIKNSTGPSWGVSAKSIHRNDASIGMTLFTCGIQLYRFPDNPTRLSGLFGTVRNIAW